jgi:hypothetical protein
LDFVKTTQFGQNLILKSFKQSNRDSKGHTHSEIQSDSHSSRAGDQRQTLTHTPKKESQYTEEPIHSASLEFLISFHEKMQRRRSPRSSREAQLEGNPGNAAKKIATPESGMPVFATVSSYMSLNISKSLCSILCQYYSPWLNKILNFDPIIYTDIFSHC